MSALDRFKRFNGVLCHIMEWVGIVAFVFMMVLTTVDVVGAKVFLAPIPGSLDLMMLAQLVCLSFAFAASYYGDRHVSVEFFIPLLPKFLQRIVSVLIDILFLALLITIVWQLFLYGADFETYGELSPTIRIPLYPFTYGAALAMIPACLVSLHNLIKSFIEVGRQ